MCHLISMTFTNNNIFIDSSLLVEFIKDRKVALLRELLSDELAHLYISETVVSEYLLYFLAVNGNASPRAIQSAGKVKDILGTHFPADFFERFRFLQSDSQLYLLVPNFMKQYNLLPNDAIILATCKIHGITKLASHDKDFIEPCKAEGIELLSED